MERERSGWDGRGWHSLCWVSGLVKAASVRWFFGVSRFVRRYDTTPPPFFFFSRYDGSKELFIDWE